MPAPFVSYRVLSDIKAAVFTVTSLEAAAGRINISSLGTVVPLFMSLDRVFLVLDVDYQIISDAGDTFIEFINELAPAGISAIEANEKITFLYSAEPT
jgi:hypothetical protein